MNDIREIDPEIRFFPGSLDFFRTGGFWSEYFRSKKGIVILDPNGYYPRDFGWPEISEPISTPDPGSLFPGDKLLWKRFSDSTRPIYFATSGSTGHPKLIPKRPDQLVSEVEFLSKKYLNQESERDWLSSVPLFHLYGFIWSFLLPWYLQRPVQDFTGLKGPIRYRKESESPSIWITVPAILDALLGYPDYLEDKPQTKGQNLIVSSGSRMESELGQKVSKLWDAMIWEIYGSTETGGMGIRFPLHSEETEIFSPIEPIIKDTELWIRSPFVSAESGFLSNSDNLSRLESSTSRKQEYYPTGDCGDLDQNKKLFLFRGRKDKILKVKGKRIHPEEIERWINSIPGVSDSMVVPTKEEYGSDQVLNILVEIKGYGQPRDPHSRIQTMGPKRVNRTKNDTEENSPEEILKKMQNDFPFPISVQTWRLVAGLPRLANGKKDYQGQKEKK